MYSLSKVLCGQRRGRFAPLGAAHEMASSAPVLEVRPTEAELAIVGSVQCPMCQKLVPNKGELEPARAPYSVARPHCLRPSPARRAQRSFKEPRRSAEQSGQIGVCPIFLPDFELSKVDRPIPPAQSTQGTPPCVLASIHPHASHLETRVDVGTLRLYARPKAVWVQSLR